VTAKDGRVTKKNGGPDPAKFTLLEEAQEGKKFLAECTTMGGGEHVGLAFTKTTGKEE